MLSNLLPLVTTKPSNKINAPTGIPPHVKLLSKLSDLLNMFQEERQNRRELQDKLSDSVKAAIEETAIANGNITHHSMTNILEKHQKQIDESLAMQNKIIDEKLAALTSQLGGQPTNNNDTPPPPPPSPYELYNWDGRFWQVPKGFMFPKDVKRKRAWELWLIGQPNFLKEDGTNGCILPYRLMDPKLLPKQIANKLKVEWRPVLKHMEAATDLPNLNENEKKQSRIYKLNLCYCITTFKAECLFLCLK